MLFTALLLSAFVGPLHAVPGPSPWESSDPLDDSWDDVQVNWWDGPAKSIPLTKGSDK